MSAKHLYKCSRMGRNSVTYSTKFDIINGTAVSYTGNITFDRDIDGWGLLMVKNFIPDFTTVTKHLIVLPYGEYRTEVYFYSNNSNAKVLETCVGGSAEVRPLYEIQHKFSNVTSGFIIKG
ncbi:uncharacterized protein LOC142333472 isoform X3 [Lycorma delicatula]|uniref:uncharacterized protein LOC142333472 isoform X3 n=1 Tax=Lycorma delicatula TaxID=130591 RepID=UPI003F519EA0